MTTKEFLGKTQRSGDCLVWTGAKLPRGYGICTWSGERWYTHRLMWTLIHRQEVPPGMCVLHTCDNPSCVRPSHLWLGTHKDNTQDMILKGRNAHGVSVGEAHPLSRLTERDIHRIRKLRGTKTAAELAKEYGVLKSQISKIQLRRAWRHVT